MFACLCWCYSIGYSRKITGSEVMLLGPSLPARHLKANTQEMRVGGKETRFIEGLAP